MNRFQEQKNPTVVCKGSTLNACVKLLRNICVHDAIAYAGIGFEATRSIVIADPDPWNGNIFCKEVTEATHQYHFTKAF